MLSKAVGFFSTAIRGLGRYFETKDYKKALMIGNTGF